MFNNALVTKDWTVIANTFNRTEVGGRGTFFEFEKEDVCLSEIGIPKGAEWRLTEEWLAREFFVEYRSKDRSNVMLYYQCKGVDYATYYRGKFYASIYGLGILLVSRQASTIHYLLPEALALLPEEDRCMKSKY